MVVSHVQSFSCKCRLRFVLFVLSALCVVHGRPYMNEEMLFTQPDGSEITLVLNGDEYYIRAETRDGYTIVRDEKTGWMCYAKLSDDGSELVSTGMPVTQTAAAKRSAPYVPQGIKLAPLEQRRKVEEEQVRLFRGSAPDYSVRMKTRGSAVFDSLPAQKDTASFRGVCKGLCVVYDFFDAPITSIYPSADSAIHFLEEKFNSLDPEKKSLRYIFRTYSQGKFDVKFIVKGVFRAPKPFSYYDKLRYGEGHSELITAALEKLDDKDFDFKQLTTKGPGTPVRGLVIANTGTPADWAKGMWNHAGSLSIGFSEDCVRFQKYCTSDARGGALAHEMGHLLAEWPDLYSAFGVETGTWDIMGGGKSDLPNPYLLYINGWNTVENIANFPAGAVVVANGVNPNSGHVYYKNSMVNECFFFKPYTRQLPLCQNIPDQGLTIWRINTRGNNFKYPETPLLVEMVHANNNINNTRTDVCFKAEGITKYNGTSAPAALWADSSKADIDIANISAADTAMIAVVGGMATSAQTHQQSIAVLTPITLLRNNNRMLLTVSPSLTAASTMNIATAAGKTVLRKSVSAGDVVDVTNLPAGVYVAQMKDVSGTRTVERFVR